MSEDFKPDNCSICGGPCYWQPRKQNTRNPDPDPNFVRNQTICGVCLPGDGTVSDKFWEELKVERTREEMGNE